MTINKGHVGSGEVVNLQKLKDKIGAEMSYTLVKTENMEVIRMVLPRGKRIEEHRVKGEIQLHCLKGKILFQIGKEVRTLQKDDWLFLYKKTPHSLSAEKDSVLLLTILFTGQSA